MSSKRFAEKFGIEALNQVTDMSTAFFRSSLISISSIGSIVPSKTKSIRP